MNLNFHVYKWRNNLRLICLTECKFLGVIGCKTFPPAGLWAPGWQIQWNQEFNDTRRKSTLFYSYYRDASIGTTVYYLPLEKSQPALRTPTRTFFNRYWWWGWSEVCVNWIVNQKKDLSGLLREETVPVWALRKTGIMCLISSLFKFVLSRLSHW